MNGCWYLQKRKLRNYHKNLSDQNRAEFDADYAGNSVSFFDY